MGSTGSSRNWELFNQNTPEPPTWTKYFELTPRLVGILWSTLLGTSDTICLTGDHSRPELWLMPGTKNGKFYAILPKMSRTDPTLVEGDAKGCRDTRGMYGWVMGAN